MPKQNSSGDEVVASGDVRVSDRLLRIESVLPLIGCRHAWLYRMVQRGLFPKPIKLTPFGRAAAWRESEIQPWIAGRKPAEPERHTAAKAKTITKRSRKPNNRDR